MHDAARAILTCLLTWVLCMSCTAQIYTLYCTYSMTQSMHRRQTARGLPAAVRGERLELHC